jgi:hypothetical protein
MNNEITNSWTLSFSLLARIALVSAERTPQDEIKQADRNKLIPPQGLLLVKVESVSTNEAAISKVITATQPTCTRLPPPAPIKEPDFNPTGLFTPTAGGTSGGSSTSDSGSSAAAPRRAPRKRRESLNRSLQEHMSTTRLQKQVSLPDPTKLPIMAALEEHEDGCSEKSGEGAELDLDLNLKGGDDTEHETNKNNLAAMRTSNICTNFRNAQRLLVPQLSRKLSQKLTPRQRSRSKGGGSIDIQEDDLVGSDSDSDSGDSFCTEADMDEEDNEDSVSKYGSRLDFIEIGMQKKSSEILKQKTMTVNPNEKSVKPRKNSNFYLYADMMNEMESIELLSKSSPIVREGVMSSLTSKRDAQREQGKWKETKEEEEDKYKKNIETNKKYIDDLVRMSQLSSQSPRRFSRGQSQDLSSGSTWEEILAKNKTERKGSVQPVGAADRKTLLRMRSYEAIRDFKDP